MKPYYQDKWVTIYHGDCREILPQLDTKVDLVLTDPPYGIGKAEWDKSSIPFLMEVISLLRPQIKDNGSFYLFHSEMQAVAELMVRLNNETDFIFRQFIVWNKRFTGSKNKGYLDGYIDVDGLRNYQQMAEYILYYTFQDGSGLSKIMGSCVYTVRDYVRSEILRARGKVNLKEINTILGTAISGGGVASAVLSVDKTCPAMITKEHYLKLREWLNKRKEYEYLRQEYEDLRYVFNNQRRHHSVWNYEIETIGNHETPKPVDLISNIILHSSNDRQIILDPFLGSGTTCYCAKKLNRYSLGIEIEEKYCEIAAKRCSQEVMELNC